MRAGSCGSVPWKRPTMTSPASCSELHVGDELLRLLELTGRRAPRRGGVRVVGRLGLGRGRVVGPGDGRRGRRAGRGRLGVVGRLAESGTPADEQDARRDHGQAGSDREHAAEATRPTPATRKRQARRASSSWIASTCRRRSASDPVLSTTWVAIASRSSRVACAAMRASASSRVQPRSSHHPLHLQLGGGVDHDAPRRRTPARPHLGQQRDVVDDDRVLGRCRLELGAAPVDQRVDDRLEPPAGVGVGEDERAHGGPVEVAVGREQVGPELLDDRRQPGRTPRHDLARDEVGVDDDGPELGEDRRHGALAGCDAPGQADPNGHWSSPTTTARISWSVRRWAGVSTSRTRCDASRRTSSIRSDQPPALIGGHQAGGPAVGGVGLTAHPAPVLQRVDHLRGRPGGDAQRVGEGRGAHPVGTGQHPQRAGLPRGHLPVGERLDVRSSQAPGERHHQVAGRRVVPLAVHHGNTSAPHPVVTS